MKFIPILLLHTFLIHNSLFAQDIFQAQRANWLKKAEENKPILVEQIKKPIRIVELIKDETAFQGWKTDKPQNLDSLYQNSFKKKSGIVIDFGEHLTGYFTFTLKALRGVSDAPTRLKFIFGEVPAELAIPFEPYTGTLSRAWLQDEIITLMDVPITYTIPRRMAFRYVKIELLGTSPYFDFGFADMTCKATTSVKNQPHSLAPETQSIIQDIDKIGLNTLKECMQTVYEDGPKRDRRLWIGDLYLESLANIYSFKNHQLTKRCLYLMASLTSSEGYLYSNAFENPEPHAQVGAPFLFEYSLLYNLTLKEYLLASNDRETALELWTVAKKQLENIQKYLDAEGLFEAEKAQKNRWWLFVDWKPDLDRQASLQGIMIFALKETYELAKLLGKEKEMAEVPNLIKKMTAAAHKSLYDKSLGMFVSGGKRQISYASQAWMILSEVANKTEGQKALKNLLQTKEAVRPGAPYLVHYYIEAMIKCGMTQEAKAEIVNYWGAMVKKGADTFWEVYDPQNELLSPYNFHPVNSYCHAWSCTPVYFIRKYPEIFQK